MALTPGANAAAASVPGPLAEQRGHAAHRDLGKHERTAHGRRGGEAGQRDHYPCPPARSGRPQGTGGAPGGEEPDGPRRATKLPRPGRRELPSRWPGKGTKGHKRGGRTARRQAWRCSIPPPVRRQDASGAPKRTARQLRSPPGRPGTKGVANVARRPARWVWRPAWRPARPSGTGTNRKWPLSFQGGPPRRVSRVHLQEPVDLDQVARARRKLLYRRRQPQDHGNYHQSGGTEAPSAPRPASPRPGGPTGRSGAAVVGTSRNANMGRPPEQRRRQDHNRDQQCRADVCWERNVAQTAAPMVGGQGSRLAATSATSSTKRAVGSTIA